MSFAIGHLSVLTVRLSKLPTAVLFVIESYVHYCNAKFYDAMQQKSSIKKGDEINHPLFNNLT